jgi:Flp pilus assembly protein TadD
MRNLERMLTAFVGIAAVSTIVACEEVDVPRPSSKQITAPQPKIAEPVVKLEVPKPIEVKKEEPKVEPKPEIVEDDTDIKKPTELIQKAREAMGKGELEHAFKLSQLAVTRAPNRSAAWNTLGRVQMQKGQRKDAIESFEKAVELNPKSSYAQNNLGLALIYDGRYDDAVDALEEATELEPVESYMWNNLGMAYEHLDRLEDARDAYKKSAELKNERAGENLARLEGVKSVMRTAKADPGKKIEDEVETVDGGIKE